MKSRIFAICLAVFMIMILPVQAVTPEELVAAFTARIKVTTRNAIGRIQEPGTVLVIQKEGLRADPPTGFMRASIIKNGVPTSAGGGGIILSGGRSLKVGERVYLYIVRAYNDRLTLVFATVDTYDVVEKGTTKTTPYQGAVNFTYDAGIANLTSDQILKDVMVWLEPEDEVNANKTKTIAIGMTPEQVIEVLGPPEKKIELGPKVVFVYKDMKVIFIDGKVADVQ